METIGSPGLIVLVVVAVAALLVVALVRRNPNSPPAENEPALLIRQLMAHGVAAPSVSQVSDAELATEQLEHYRALIARGEPLPTVRSTTSGDACYTAETGASIPIGEYDVDSGHVDVTDKGLFFVGSDRRVTCPWPRVLTIELEPSTVFVHLTNKTKPIEIDYRSRPEAELAHLIALTIWRRQQQQPPKQQRRSVRARDVASPAAEPVGTTIDLPGSGNDFTVPIVGESYRQAALKNLGGDRRQRGEEVFFTAALIPEPSNAHDPHAVQVFIYKGGHVGYLAKDVALEYRAVSERLSEMHAAGLCRAKLIGGQKGKPSIGVILCLASPDEVLSAIAPPQSF